VCPRHVDSLHAEGGALCHRYRFFNYSQRLMKNHIKEHGQVKVFGEERTPQCDGGGARRPLPAGWDAYPAWRGLAPTSQFAEQPLYRAHATEALSMPLTCLLGLQHFYPPDAALWGKESLTIHVVGAGAFEYRGRAFWEELLHVMPQLKTINVALMGPEMADIVRGESDGHSDGHYPATNMTCCDACKARACKYVIAIHGKLPQFQPFLLFSMRPASTRAALIFTCSPPLTGATYEDFLASEERCAAIGGEADLMVAFNCGIHCKGVWNGAKQLLQAQWRPALEELLRRGTPCLFTSWDQVRKFIRIGYAHWFDFACGAHFADSTIRARRLPAPAGRDQGRRCFPCVAGFPGDSGPPGEPLHLAGSRHSPSPVRVLL